MSRRARIIVLIAVAAVITTAAGALAWRGLAPAAATTADLRRAVLRLRARRRRVVARGRLRPDPAHRGGADGDAGAVRGCPPSVCHRHGAAQRPRDAALAVSTEATVLLPEDAARPGPADGSCTTTSVRRTLSGDLILRALVQRYEDKANWHFRTGKLKRLGRNWWPTGLVMEYRLTQDRRRLAHRRRRGSASSVRREDRPAHARLPMSRRPRSGRAASQVVQVRPVAALELRRGVLLQLPLGDAALRASLRVPLVAQPAGGAARLGVVDDHVLVAVRHQRRRRSRARRTP